MTARLTDAVLTLRYRQIKALLDQGVDINGRTDDGRTPLMAALGISDPDRRNHMFRFLIHHDADMLESDADDVTVFQQCCRLGFLDLMQVILKKAGVSAVNLMGRDKHGRTALYHAVVSTDIKAVNMVLDFMELRQQSVDIADKDGLTPLLYARRHGLIEIADVLLERGKANPRICDRLMHMNADEWAAEAKRRQEEEESHAKKQARERYMIFPPIDHATKRKEKLSKLKAKTASLPNLTKKNVKFKLSPSPSHVVTHLPSLSSPHLPILKSSCSSSLQSSARTDNDLDLRTKSIDSAITLLGLASQAADDKEYAVSFVSSKTHAPITVSSDRADSDRQMRRAWSNIMDAYSVQNTSNFRRPAKPPPLPEIAQDVSGQKTKMSTLAIILRAGRGGAHGRSPRGRHGKTKLRSISESRDDGVEMAVPGGKLSNRRRTSSLSTLNSPPHGHGKSKPLSNIEEDVSKWKTPSKSGQTDNRSTQERDALPDIKVS
ncbi:uncharacterized protein [Diadema antillarum]|uniref:uncharacterized protein n=1 Tax=Diadema antillarum TaxID=105358 RepID=UPI003A8610AD